MPGPEKAISGGCGVGARPDEGGRRVPHASGAGPSPLHGHVAPVHLRLQKPADPEADRFNGRALRRTRRLRHWADDIGARMQTAGEARAQWLRGEL